VEPLTGTTLDALADGLIWGTVELWQLPPCVATFYYLGEAYAARNCAEQIRRAQADADHYYSIAARGGFGVPIIKPQGKAYWELLEIRGQHEEAARVRAEMEALTFAGVRHGST